MRKLIGIGLLGMGVLYIIGLWSIRHEPEFRESVGFPYVLMGVVVMFMLIIGFVSFGGKGNEDGH